MGRYEVMKNLIDNRKIRNYVATRDNMMTEFVTSAHAIDDAIKAMNLYIEDAGDADGIYNSISVNLTAMRNELSTIFLAMSCHNTLCKYVSECDSQEEPEATTATVDVSKNMAIQNMAIIETPAETKIRELQRMVTDLADTVADMSDRLAAVEKKGNSFF